MFVLATIMMFQSMFADTPDGPRFTTTLLITLMLATASYTHFIFLRMHLRWLRRQGLPIRIPSILVSIMELVLTIIVR
jgi:hypothetical protein